MSEKGGDGGSHTSMRSGRGVLRRTGLLSRPAGSPSLPCRGIELNCANGFGQQARRLAKHEAGWRRVAERAESALERLAGLCKGRRGMQGLPQLPAWLPTQVTALQDAPQCYKAGTKASDISATCRKVVPSVTACRLHRFHPEQQLRPKSYCDPVLWILSPVFLILFLVLNPSTFWKEKPCQTAEERVSKTCRLPNMAMHNHCVLSQKQELRALGPCGRRSQDSQRGRKSIRYTRAVLTWALLLGSGLPR